MKLSREVHRNRGANLKQAAGKDGKELSPLQ